MKKAILISWFSLLWIIGFSQHDVILGGSLMGGIPFNKYEGQRQILGSRFLTSHMSAGISAEYRFLNRIGLEVGLSQNVQLWNLQDKKFPERNEGFKVRMKSRAYYWSYYSALNYIQPLTDYFHLYGSLGYAIHNLGGGAASQTKNFIVTNENLHLTNRFQEKSQSWYLEAGFQSFVSDRTMFFMGIRFNKGLTSFSEGTYYSELEGTVLTEDKFSSTGTFVGFNIGLKFNLFHKDKYLRKQQQKKPEVITPTIVSSKKAGDTLSAKIKGRPLVVNEAIEVAAGQVKIYVWDDQKVDGDKISLNLNDDWVLQNYSLTKTQKLIPVSLKPGENYLVLYALNLGDIPPNTAILMVDDGHKQQRLHLASDLKTSGTLIINYKR